jgi:hypothetical protein
VRFVRSSNSSSDIRAHRGVGGTRYVRVPWSQQVPCRELVAARILVLSFASPSQACWSASRRRGDKRRPPHQKTCQINGVAGTLRPAQKSANLHLVRSVLPARLAPRFLFLGGRAFRATVAPTAAPQPFLRMERGIAESLLNEFPI